MRSLWHVVDLSQAGKDVCPQMQIVVLLASQIQQKIFVRTPRGINVCFVCKERIVRVKLLCEMNELTTTTWILTVKCTVHAD